VLPGFLRKNPDVIWICLWGYDIPSSRSIIYFFFKEKSTLLGDAAKI